ncbi:MAG: hypothetical protein CL910_11290 [Deltaproteobacteria bacterium]|nr:hypothetical protein [Deltaproteobacteria bacterium]
MSSHRIIGLVVILSLSLMGVKAPGPGKSVQSQGFSAPGKLRQAAASAAVAKAAAPKKAKEERKLSIQAPKAQVKGAPAPSDRLRRSKISIETPKVSVERAPALSDRLLKERSEVIRPRHLKRVPISDPGPTMPDFPGTSTNLLGDRIGVPSAFDRGAAAKHMTRPGISSALRRQFMGPDIEMFEAETAECVEPDPTRPLLRYRVRAKEDGPGIARIEINALWEHFCAATGGSRLCAETQNPDKVRRIYSWDAPPSDPAEEATRFGIPDDAAGANTFAYVLVVTDSTGHRKSRRIGFDYKVHLPELGEFTRRAGAQEFALTLEGAADPRDVSATAADGRRATDVMVQRGDELIFRWNASLCDHGNYSVRFTHQGHATGCDRETRTVTRTIDASQFASWCRAAAPPPPPEPEPEPEPERDSTWEVDCACANGYGEAVRARIRTCAAPPEIPAYTNGLNLQCGILGQRLTRTSTRGRISCAAIIGSESLVSRDSCPGIGFLTVID